MCRLRLIKSMKDIFCDLSIVRPGERYRKQVLKEVESDGLGKTKLECHLRCTKDETFCCGKGILITRDGNEILATRYETVELE